MAEANVVAYANTIARGKLHVTLCVGIEASLDKHGVTGAQFPPVRAKGAKHLQPTGWCQLVIASTDAEVTAPTQLGVDPFDKDPKGECRCFGGDLMGLNLLSEVSVRSATVGKNDIVASSQFVGARRGLLRPERIVIVSPKVQQLIASEKLRGCEIERAHLV